MADFLIDTFTAADGTQLNAHAPNTGGAWAANFSNLLIGSNKVGWSSFGRAASQNAAVPPTADYDVSADIALLSSATAGTVNLMGRASLGTFWADGYAASFYVSGKVFELAYWTGGNKTALGTWSDATYTSGVRRLTLSMVGSALAVLVDGVSRVVATNALRTVKNFAAIAGADGLAGDILVDNLNAGPHAGAPAGTHVVTGRGSFAIAGLPWLSTALTGIPSRLTYGNAEPPNYYHVGMLSWAGPNGAVQAYPVTRVLDLVAVPSGMTTVYYEFASGITATIVEKSTP